MLIYRPHRGSLAGAMKEAKTFNSLEDIKNYVANEWNNLWGIRFLTKMILYWTKNLMMMTVSAGKTFIIFVLKRLVMKII